MIDLAKNFQGKPVLVKEMARRQGISERYLEQILLALKKAGLVSSSAGVGGGYILARDPGSVTVRQIVESLEGSLVPVECVEREGFCPRAVSCVARQVWRKVGQTIAEALDSFTLKQLAASQEEMSEDRELVYEI